MRRDILVRRARYIRYYLGLVAREKGALHAARGGMKYAAAYLKSKFSRSTRTFALGGKRYPYFHSLYNVTWDTERAVEVSVAWAEVQRAPARRMLEVGNVLSHYFAVNHDIIDKYEIGPGVLNQDVVEFVPARQYDLIVSISTLEHVGWDEAPRDPGKTLRAIEHLRTLLAPGGTLLVTLPAGYQPQLDRLLRDGALRFAEQHALKRVSRDNRWVEVPLGEALDSRYDAPYRGANGLIVGIDRAAPTPATTAPQPAAAGDGA